MAPMPPQPTWSVRRVAPREEALLARLGELEPVHPVAGADDLADRVDDTDRRVFVLEPAGGGDPLTVVWVALTRGVPSRITQVLDPEAVPVPASAADTAVFYSIWNVGDSPGPGRGRELIVGASAHLAAELPHLATFVTLSPAPGLAAMWQPGWPAPGEPGFPSRVARALTSLDGDGRPREPVARFHLSNGARMWRVNLDADPSERARERSFGVMVNYRYSPEDREANRRELDAGFVPVSAAVAELLA